ncbi:DnaD domain protein [Bacillus sp. HNG]|uniref:DnaD domain-containing protein n=1 Tax=Bacillus sp. HNG TaxID=2293325 RepID=UPI000E2ED923|nr:DnaD domain protein [Bacillus sp. HNG]RFB18203.1 DnaD domain protein [Bacillus sp. HNG]
MYGNILLNERPLIIVPSLAVTLGINESIILQQVHYWLQRSKHIRLNQKWVYFTYDQLVEQIPFISKSTIRRTIARLESNGYLSSQNFNKLKLDKTKWYTINYENLSEIHNEANADDLTILADELPPSMHPEHEMCSEWTDDMPEVSSPPVQVEQTSGSTWHVEEFSLNTPIPEITTKITTKITSEISSSSSSKDLKQNYKKEDPYQFFVQNGFGTIGSFLTEKIKSWCNDLSNELVIEAMKLAIENSSKRWNYVEAILRDWVDKDYQTLNDVQAARVVYKHQLNTPFKKKPIRQEYIPKWIHNRDQDDEPVHDTNFKNDNWMLEEQNKKLKERGNSHSYEPIHNPDFAEKKRLFEERLKKNQHYTANLTSKNAY